MIEDPVLPWLDAIALAAISVGVIGWAIAEAVAWWRERGR